MRASSQGMHAQNQRLLNISQNLAMAGTRATAPGQDPYRRKTITFKQVMDKEYQVNTIGIKSIGVDQSPFPKIHAPSDPAADQDGMVQETNVRPFVEMADMREASRSHEANLRAYEKALAMLQDTISLLKS